MSVQQSKFEIIMELVELGERAFIHKLKKTNPLISLTEIEESVEDWYRDRPGAALGDGTGVPGDVGRFHRCDRSSK
ncbi:MAG: hypothetical protein SGI77_09590 [Pirellulaceae bacterium]|nr:hypothetical protein [Pirellulaceae bacterium]